MTHPAKPQVTVLGVGNPIMGDDGTGLELLARLRKRCPKDARVRFVDGGTGGMELLEVVEYAPHLLILDAVAGEVPGTVVRVQGQALNRLLASQLSPHQVGLADVLAAARLLGREPSVVEILGIVPAAVELRLGLSQPVTSSIDAALAQASTVLDGWLGASQP